MLALVFSLAFLSVFMVSSYPYARVCACVSQRFYGLFLCLHLCLRLRFSTFLWALLMLALVFALAFLSVFMDSSYAYTCVCACVS